ncbi:zinc-ribbon domain-containing protein [Pelagibacterales bacterium SAG-MED45]|nr:zinc-ribbon domain-containing protein [Pelagibacterales bacterium SAG-MED45]
MIIECPCKKKKFNIDVNLIPVEGRNLQCGSCDRIWFYKKENPITEPPHINENLIIEEKDNVNQVNEDSSKKHEESRLVKDIEDKETEISEIKEIKTKPDVAKSNPGSKFFSYLIVFLISLGALFILLDTLKTPLINVFPGLEQVLFNLYETLKDIKLFIIDLS